MRVRVSMPEDSWVQSWLLSFGEQLTVLQPKHVRELLANTAHALITKYEGPY